MVPQAAHLESATVARVLLSPKMYRPPPKEVAEF